MWAFLGTAHGASEEHYGGTHELLGGTSQGNVFSGRAFRDVSCFTFKEIENKRLGTIIKSWRNN